MNWLHLKICGFRQSMSIDPNSMPYMDYVVFYQEFLFKHLALVLLPYLQFQSLLFLNWPIVSLARLKMSFHFRSPCFSFSEFFKLVLYPINLDFRWYYSAMDFVGYWLDFVMFYSPSSNVFSISSKDFVRRHYVD